MNTRVSPAPIKQSVVVEAPIERAFKVFTEPPHRLLLSSDISLCWQIETNPNHTSEWEVRFIAETTSRTRLELEHRHLERHGDGREGVRAGGDGDHGRMSTMSSIRHAARNFECGSVRSSGAADPIFSM